MYHPQPLSWKTRLAIFIPLMAMGSMALFVYFQFEHESILLVMWLTLIVVQFVLSVRTARLAINMIAGVRKRDGKRTHLDMSPDEAKAYPRNVLVAVLRTTWIEHIMLTLPRSGVALGFMQFFHMSDSWTMKEANSIFFARPFIYYSTNIPYSGFPTPFVYPDFFQVALMVIALVGFAVFESLLIITISLFVACHTKRKLIVRTVVARIGLSMLGLLIFGVLSTVPQVDRYYASWAHEYRYVLFSCESVNRTPIDVDDWTKFHRQRGVEWKASGKCAENFFHLTVLRAWEGTQFSLLSLFDHGTILGSNILRPVVPINPDDYSSGDYFGYYLDENWELQASYMPFVFRNILSALLAFGIYGVMILAMLRVARRRLVRQSLTIEAS